MLWSRQPWRAIHSWSVAWGLGWSVVFWLWFGAVDAVLHDLIARPSAFASSLIMLAGPSLITSALIGGATRSVPVLLMTLTAPVAAAWIGGDGTATEPAPAAAWLFIVCSTMLTWAIVKRRAEPWRWEPLKCRACGYDLGALRTPLCPECGARLFPSPPRPNAVLAARQIRVGNAAHWAAPRSSDSAGVETPGNATTPPEERGE